MTERFEELPDVRDGIRRAVKRHSDEAKHLVERAELLTEIAKKLRAAVVANT